MGRKKKKKKRGGEETEEEIGRKIVIPATEEEMFGIITQFMGGSLVRVYCSDGNIRLCRIPGRIRRRVWMREGDLVLVAIWPFQPERGDIIHRYTSSQVSWLKKRGYLSFLETMGDEFEL